MTARSRVEPVGQATMADVARLAGVSKMTVSRLLTNPAAVAEETAERIRAAIERLGYVPDRVAGSLSSRRTGFVALVLPTLTNTNFADTAHGLTDALRAEGYQLIIGYTMYDEAEEEQVVRALLARRPEALVLAETVHARATTQLLLGAGIPVVETWDLTARPIDMLAGFSNRDAGHAIAAGRRSAHTGRTTVRRSALAHVKRDGEHAGRNGEEREGSTRDRNDLRRRSRRRGPDGRFRSKADQA